MATYYLESIRVGAISTDPSVVKLQMVYHSSINPAEPAYYDEAECPEEDVNDFILGRIELPEGSEWQ